MLDLCVVFVDFIRPSPVLSSAPSSPAAALPLLIFNFALALLPLLLLLVLLLFASTVCLNYTITITITLSSLCCLLCQLKFPLSSLFIYLVYFSYLFIGDFRHFISLFYAECLRTLRFLLLTFFIPSRLFCCCAFFVDAETVLIVFFFSRSFAR